MSGQISGVTTNVAHTNENITNVLTASEQVISVTKMNEISVKAMNQNIAELLQVSDELSDMSTQLEVIVNRN